MPDKPLNRLYFPVFDKKTAGTGRVLTDALGFFSCRANVAAFLDITQFAVAGVIVKERKNYTRSLALVGGYTLTKSTEDDATVAESRIVLPIGGKGSKTAQLLTGAPIGTTKKYHTVSFRFPGWITIEGISDALGELIPDTKIKNPPGATEVWGRFHIIGGRTYPITRKAEAEADQEVQVPATATDMQNLATQAGAKSAKPAAGTT